jgi:N utilization substance protein A
MNPSEVLRIVDAIHRDKNIDKEIVFEGIEAALVSAAKKHFGEEEEVVVQINREDGSITGTHNGVPLSPEQMSERIGAQAAKQVMIQKIREAERDALCEEYLELKDQLVTGVIHRYDGGMATVTLSNAEAILPKSEQIPGETHHPNERIRAVVCDVQKSGSRVKIVLSRARGQLVARLFEQEIPEIADGIIEVKAISRESGYRSKVAVSSMDPRVDCVGACVGVRGNRIKNIVDELAGERIDIVRYSDDMQVLIPNALQPAEVEEVILCQMMGRAIVLVREDQLSLAIGRRGQNVRLASKLCGWDIEIMTREELDEQIEQAFAGFSQLEGMSDELSERLVGEGFLSYDDLSVIEPDILQEMGGLTEEQVNLIVDQAEEKAREAEIAAAEQKRQQREQDRLREQQQESEEQSEQEAAEPEDSAAEEPAAEPEEPDVQAASGESGADQPASGAQTESPSAEESVPSEEDAAVRSAAAEAPDTSERIETAPPESDHLDSEPIESGLGTGEVEEEVEENAAEESVSSAAEQEEPAERNREG